MQLQMLVAIAEEGSFQRAARRVFRTAAAVSMSMRKLEREIGAPVFNRSDQRQHVLTREGRLLLHYAQRMLLLHRDALLAVKENQRADAITLRLGATEIVNTYLLPQVIQKYKELCPDVKLAIKCDDSAALHSALRLSQIDLGILTSCPTDEGFKAHAIATDEHVLIMSNNHRFVRLDSVRITDLEAEVMIVEGRRSALYESIETTFREFCVPLRVLFEVGTIEAVKRLVARGVGVSIVPSICVREEVELGRVRIRRLPEFGEGSTLWAVHARKGPESPLIEQFLQVFKTATAECSKTPLLPQLPPT